MAHTMHVIFHLSEDRKYLVEVKRYAHLAHVNKWCMDHFQADIFIYSSKEGQSTWLKWSHIYRRTFHVDGATVLRQHEILNTEPVPFGNPDTWIALSD